jgi:hypothetical protein
VVSIHPSGGIANHTWVDGVDAVWSDFDRECIDQGHHAAVEGGDNRGSLVRLIFGKPTEQYD